MTVLWLSRYLYLSMMYVCWSSTELISILHHSARFAPDAAVQTLGCQGFQASLLETGYACEMLDYTELLRKWWDYINICTLQCMILKRSPSNTSCSESLELRCLDLQIVYGGIVDSRSWGKCSEQAASNCLCCPGLKLPGRLTERGIVQLCHSEGDPCIA